MFNLVPEAFLYPKHDEFLFLCFCQQSCQILPCSFCTGVRPGQLRTRHRGLPGRHRDGGCGSEWCHWTTTMWCVRPYSKIRGGVLKFSELWLDKCGITVGSQSVFHMFIPNFSPRAAPEYSSSTSQRAFFLPSNRPTWSPSLWSSLFAPLLVREILPTTWR